MRCGAYGPMRFLFVPNRSVGLQAVQTDAMHMVRCDAYGPSNVANQNGAISPPRLNDRVGIREYSNSGKVGHILF